MKTPSIPAGLEGQLDVAATKSGKRLKPVFSERQKESTVNLKDGHTVALTGFEEELARGDIFRGQADKKQSTQGTPPRKLIVFVSARIINPAGVKSSPSPAPAK